MPVGANRNLYHEVCFQPSTNAPLLLVQNNFVIRRTIASVLELRDTSAGDLLGAGIVLLRETQPPDTQPVFKALVFSLICDIRSYNPAAPGLSYDLILEHEHITQLIRASVPKQLGDGFGTESLHDLWDMLSPRTSVHSVVRRFIKQEVVAELHNLTFEHGSTLGLGLVKTDATPTYEAQRLRKKLANVVFSYDLGAVTVPWIMQFLHYAGFLSQLGPWEHGYTFTETQMVPTRQHGPHT